VQRAPGIPCALYFSWANGFCKNSGASRRENAEVHLIERRHCEERSDEAIHSFLRQNGFASLRSQ